MSKPFEIHPALLALLAVLFLSVLLSLWGVALFPTLATLIGLVIVWTAVVFLILFSLVWLARTIYTRRHLPSKTSTNIRELFGKYKFRDLQKLKDELRESWG